MFLLAHAECSQQRWGPNVICVGLRAGGGGQRRLVAPCIPHIVCRRGQRELALANFLHSPLHTQEEGMRRSESELPREARERLHFLGEQDCKLDNRPTFFRLQGNLCCCLPARHRELSAIVPAFQSV